MFLLHLSMLKAPLPINENERLTALKEYDILDSEGEEIFDEIVSLASFTCNTPISTITLIDEHRQWFKSKIGIPDASTPRDVAFCAHAILQNEVMIVKDAAKDERFHDNPLVLNKPDIRFYAGMPLVSPEGYKLGTICVIDTKPRDLSEKQNLALRALSNQVMKLLELRRKNAELQKIHSMHNRLLSVVSHDLRSPINSIDGLLLLAENYPHTREEYAELIPRMRLMVDNANSLLLNLLHWAKTQIEGVSLPKENLSINKTIYTLVKANAPLFETKNNQIYLPPTDHQITAHRHRLEFIFRNLILNANKYMNNGQVTISATKTQGKTEISISDTGPGIHPNMQSNLFQWGKNQSSEGTQGEKGSGLGLPMCKEFVEQMGGKIWLQSTPQKGTTFFFTLPD